MRALGFSLLIASCLLMQKATRAGVGEQAKPDTSNVEMAVLALAHAGFENVAATVTTNRYVLTFENRRFRFDVTGVREAISVLRPFIDPAQPVTLILQRRGLPIRRIDFPTGINGGQYSSTDTRTEWAALSSEGRANRSFRRVDLALQPELLSQLGNYTDAVRVLINVVPELTVTLWPGAGARAQLIIPVYNELPNEFRFSTHVRPGILSVNQTVRLPQNTFASISVGFFRVNRYGVDLEARTYLNGGRLAIGGRVGYTGVSLFENGGWSYLPLDLWTGALTFDIAVPRYAILIRSSIERFAYEDRGARLEIVRAFGETRISLFGLFSDGRNNAGFSIAIPLFPGKYSRPNWIRVRPARNVAWVYRARELDLEGQRYATGHEIDRLWGGVYPGIFDNLFTRAGSSP